MRTPFFVVVSLVVAALPLAWGKRKLVRPEKVYEYMYHRDWDFETHYFTKFDGKWCREGLQRVSLNRNRIAKFPKGVRGIWNHNILSIADELEIEVTINEDDSKYIRYTIDTRTGRWFKNTLWFPTPGRIELIDSYVPTPETTTLIGTFTLRPAQHRPMTDRNLKCFANNQGKGRLPQFLRRGKNHLRPSLPWTTTTTTKHHRN